MPSNDVDRICAICEKSPATMVYGAMACGGCKNFFLRTTTAIEKKLKCLNGGECPVKFGNIKCMKCRYEKCLQVGMIPEVTGRRLGCSLREKRAQSKLSKKKVLASKSLFKIRENGQELSVKNFAPHLYDGKGTLEIVNDLINTQKYGEVFGKAYLKQMFITQNVLSSMKKGQMGDAKFVLMKIIICFSTSMRKERSAQIVRKAFNKYSSLLLENLDPRFGSNFGKIVLNKEIGIYGKLTKEVFHRM
ncbi:unnamed protein product, partial [Mesorhabditis belari]|uniref:Nuclear receptor domain-containing protein n=1 Tax=Mesorhabditis belari TaxID=2138241 RepID=A0AAF3JAY3_9BILA